MNDSQSAHRPSLRSAWLFFASTGFLAALVTSHCLWLVLKYVPLHAAVLAGVGVTLPLETRFCIEASSWTVRILPFLILAFVFIAPGLVALAIVAAVRWKGQTDVLRGAAWCCLAIALGGVGASGVVVHAIHSAYGRVATDPHVQESIKAYQKFQEERRALQNAAPKEP